MNAQCVASNGGEHPVCQFHLLTMLVSVAYPESVSGGFPKVANLGGW